jgi:hypothetical protein
MTNSQYCYCLSLRYVLLPVIKQGTHGAFHYFVGGFQDIFDASGNACKRNPLCVSDKHSCPNDLHPLVTIPLHSSAGFSV